VGGTVEIPVGRVKALGLLIAPLFVTELPLLPAPPPPPPQAVRSNMKEVVADKRRGECLFFMLELFVDYLKY
jgi:hypothetical protein